MLQQRNLFASTLEEPVSIAEVSEHLSVSEASVRNWIKTGYLQFNKNFGITRRSFEEFCSNVAGVDKLNKRANKSLVDCHDHGKHVSKIIKACETKQDFSQVAEEYETGLSNAYRNKEGIYYTPDSICISMFSDTPSHVEEKRFCDPCCGGGNFIIAALRHGYRPENIFGYDIDPTAVKITKHRIFDETGFQSSNIICADFLEISTSLDQSLPEFDTILTNPPWGKKLPKEVKSLFGELLGAGRSLDTSSLFFLAALATLKDDGYLAFLMPEAFFKIATFQDVRRQLLSYSLVSVRNFEKPFKGLLTKAQSFCIQKIENKNGQVHCVAGKEAFERAQNSFSKNPANIINFESSADDTAVLSRLYDKPHITLEGGARWGLGIVTGNNKKFFRDQYLEGLMPVYKGTDIHKDHLDAPKTYIPKDLSLYQQVAPVEIFEASEKMLYRFISSELVFYNDNNQSYCLNSVNMIVLSDNFPVSSAVIVQLFNSDLFNWVFGKIFNTHKILMADLEKMPIPIDFLKGNDLFLEDELLEHCGIEKINSKKFRVRGG